jgi:hypothetical protein
LCETGSPCKQMTPVENGSPQHAERIEHAAAAALDFLHKLEAHTDTYICLCIPLAPRNLLFLCTSFFVSTELELQAPPCFQFYLKNPSSDLLHSFTFLHQGASSWLPSLVFVFQSSLLLQSQNCNSTQLLWNSQFLTLNCCFSSCSHLSPFDS